MYQFIGIIHVGTVPGLASILRKLYELSLFIKDEPAVNEHRYHITKAIYRRNI